jgi:glutamate racemase
MNQLIGLFDSGLGGLTVLRQLLARRPHQPCVYLGDTARLPYGERSPQEIRSIACEVVRWLRSQGVDLLVMACNTTNALAFEVAVAEAGVPVVGLIDSAAAEITTGRVGVLATPATAASGAYRHAIEAARPGTLVLEMGCPAFVPLIEAGDLMAPALRQAAADYLAPLLRAGVDTLVLGCSHYPLLLPLLRQLLPAEMLVIDPAEATAQRLVTLLGALGDDGRDAPQALSGPAVPPIHCRFCVTGEPAPFIRGATPLLGLSPHVEQVDLRSPSGAF